MVILWVISDAIPLVNKIRVKGGISSVVMHLCFMVIPLLVILWSSYIIGDI